MLPKDAVASCPNDGCALQPFKTVKAPPGYTLALHGCRFCNFDHIIAVATDASGDVRPVARWAIDSESGLYVLVEEYGRTPPTWLELTCAALPQRK